jgi:death on curing protein
MEQKCLRCGHSWKTRKEEKPKTCPKCKSPYWSTPSKITTKEFVEGFNDKIINLHEHIIGRSGGEKGIRDEGGIYNSSFKILKFVNKKYDKPSHIGAYVLQDLATRHYFVDGNKRTAYCLAKIMLILHGLHLKVNYEGSVEFIMEIARYENPKTFKEIDEWIKKNIVSIEEKKLDKYLKELYYDITYKKRRGSND